MLPLLSDKLLGDVLLARCGVRDRDVQPVGALYYWLHGGVLLRPIVPLPMRALPELRQHPPTLPGRGSAIPCHERRVQGV